MLDYLNQKLDELEGLDRDLLRAHMLGTLSVLVPRETFNGAVDSAYNFIIQRRADLNSPIKKEENNV
jgi:hypothetical protein